MKKRIIKIVSLCCILTVLVATCGCTLNQYSVAELRELYPKAIENSLNSDLFFWKETVIPTDGLNSFRKCNVYAEIDKKKYEPLREANGDYSNMDVEIYVEENSKKMASILCGDASSESKDGEKKSYLFQTTYEKGDTVISQTKKTMTSKEYVNSPAFLDTYGMKVMLQELEYMTVDDMDFDGEKASMSHKGHVVKVSFQIKDSYLERYRQEFGTESMFADSAYVTLEIAYDKIASFVVYANKKLDSKMSVETETYKLQIVYFGPIVNMPKYDAPEWKDA